MSGFGRLTSVAIAGALAIGTSAVSPPQAGAQSVRGARSAAQEAGVGAKPPGCDKNAGARKARCYLAVQPASALPAAATTPCAVDESAGYTPCNLQDAYGLTRLSATDGKGSTVAVVDPDDDPDAASDLNVYRSTYGLPPCTTASKCFEKVNQDGGIPVTTTGHRGCGSTTRLRAGRPARLVTASA